MPLEYCNCCGKILSSAAAWRHRRGQGPRNVLAGQVRQLIDLDDADDIWDNKKIETILEGLGGAFKLGRASKRQRLSSSVRRRDKNKSDHNKENSPPKPLEDSALHNKDIGGDVDDVVEIQVEDETVDKVSEDIDNQQTSTEDNIPFDISDGSNPEDSSALPTIDEETPSGMTDEEIELWDNSCSSEGSESDSESIPDLSASGLEHLPHIGEEWRKEWVQDRKQQTLVNSH